MADMQIDPGRRAVSLDPRDPEFYNDPYPHYRAIRDRAPIFKWEQYGHWCFARHAEVNALLRDRRFGRQITHVVSREALGWPDIPERLKPFYAFESHSLLELEPPEHTRIRGLVNRAFLSRAVERLRPRIAALAHELIDGFIEQGETDLLASFATRIPVIIIAELLGVPQKKWRELLDWSHRMVAMYQARRNEAIERDAVEATIAFSDLIRVYIQDRRSEPHDDLITHLIAAEQDGSTLSEEELVTTVILLLNAGHEATVHVIGNGVKALLESGFAASAAARHVEEILRYDPPLHLFTRYALENLEFAGLRLKQGETMGLLLGAANRDPARFTEPDRFEPSRTPNPHVSFGAGIHFCIGAPLAPLELEVTLPILFERLPSLRLTEKPKYRDSYHFHGLEALKVAW